MEPLTLALVIGGWLIMCGLSFACFRASRDDGDRTPQGKMARGFAFIGGFVFAMIALMPLADLAEHWWKS